MWEQEQFQKAEKGLHSVRFSKWYRRTTEYNQMSNRCLVFLDCLNIARGIGNESLNSVEKAGNSISSPGPKVFLLPILTAAHHCLTASAISGGGFSLDICLPVPSIPPPNLGPLRRIGLALGELRHSRCPSGCRKKRRKSTSQIHYREGKPRQTRRRTVVEACSPCVMYVPKLKDHAVTMK